MGQHWPVVKDFVINRSTHITRLIDANQSILKYDTKLLTEGHSKVHIHTLYINRRKFAHFTQRFFNEKWDELIGETVKTIC